MRPLALAEAFSALSAEQSIEACHHDYRLSGEVRKAARNLAELIGERATLMAEEGYAQAREDTNWKRGWDLAGDRIALSRAANQ